MRSMTSLSMLSHVSSHGAPRSLAGPVRLLGVPACFKSPHSAQWGLTPLPGPLHPFGRLREAEPDVL